MRTAWSQGVDGWDVDLPTFLEANWITNTVAKVLWISVYLLVYGARPMIIRPKSFGAPFLAETCLHGPNPATCCAREVLSLPTLAPILDCGVMSDTCCSWLCPIVVKLEGFQGTAWLRCRETRGIRKESPLW